jgi:hypothetical protein
MSETAPTPSDFRDYLLAEIRCAALRARLAALDIDAAGVALRGGMITPEVALEWVNEAGAIDYF